MAAHVGIKGKPLKARDAEALHAQLQHNVGPRAQVGSRRWLQGEAVAAARQHQEPVPSCEVAGGGTLACVPLAWHSLRRKGAPNSSQLLLSLGPLRRLTPFGVIAASLVTGP